ncbi:rab11 family-interacting protein 5-like isoform X2 [Myxocyprinus asiaticus]|uniref:rab11 family-interacting protein 5-like isoform X2 n=1 Tax=Myxocyprinus asiaticus TaxID=70543 RepID=UPI0022236485|nr:rab11 family-interacting protein 5-like isoform X2 [Myxocyprinus asiaticus]
MSLVKCDEEQRWMPTHVQVTVLRARGLRAKGKHGTSDVYTIIQLGKEKYSTCVMEKTTEPEWGEECSFELLPGILEERGRDAYPPGSGDLTLTVMHRALIGLDVFLGEAVIPLDLAFQDRKCMKNEWNRLHSKTGKKEKERGELQVTVQFTRHNLTASLYDLSMKDKPRSAFDKLRQRMRAKKRSAEKDSSSAIVAGGCESLVRTRGRLPSDGGGEEDYEDDEGGEVRRSKMRSFFLRGRLRKSSDTRSSTSLGSESSESSSRGGSLSPTAGISVVVSDLSSSPSNSSNLTADNSPEHTVAPSPQVSPVRHVYGNEMCDFNLPVPHSSENDSPILLPSVCINGNPVETSPLTHHPPSLILQQPQPESTKLVTQSGQAQATKLLPQKTQSTEPKNQTSAETWLSKSESKPRPEPQLSALGLLQKGSSLSLSLQNLDHRGEEKQSGIGRRWSFDKPGEEEKAAIVAALEYAGRVTDESVIETVIPVGNTEIQSKKRRCLFSHGRGVLAGKGPITSKEETEHAQPHKGWFSSKDLQSKPRSDHSRSSSSWSGGSTTPDLLRTGNFKGSLGVSQMDGSMVTFISYFEGLTDKDDFENFARLKFSEEETKNSVTPPPLLMKPNNQEPLGDLDGLMVSDINDVTASVSTLTVETSTESAPNSPKVSESKVNCICSNDNKPDLTNPGAYGCPEFGLNFSIISLPENYSLEFLDMNTFACPYSALSNSSHKEVNAVASHPKECPTMNLSPQIPKLSVTQPDSEADIVCTEPPPTVFSELSEEVSVSL